MTQWFTNCPGKKVCVRAWYFVAKLEVRFRHADCVPRDLCPEVKPTSEANWKPQRSLVSCTYAVRCLEEDKVTSLLGFSSVRSPYGRSEIVLSRWVRNLGYRSRRFVCSVFSFSPLGSLPMCFWCP
jgi:hypothetical protein